jgi:carboxyl-terminal processing protease
MKLWLCRWMVVMAAALVAACGGDGGGGSSPNPNASLCFSPNSASTQPFATTPLPSGYPGLPPQSCTVSEQRAWVRDYLNDRYYWYREQRPPNEAAASMPAYLDSLLAKTGPDDEPDRYSGARVSGPGQAIFYGYTVVRGPSDRLLVQYVEPNAPAENAGLRRGDELLKINGFTISQLMGGTITLPNGQGVTRTFEVSRNGSTTSFTATGAFVTPAIVLKDAVVTSPAGKRVGYMVYQAFESDAVLQRTIARLKAANVSEFVLDLRYNGGGSTAEAGRLATLLAGNTRTGVSSSCLGVFARYSYNDRYSGRNFSQPFNTQLGSAPFENLSRLFVITSEETASASEMVINGLRPYMQVVTIGETTFGKPFAFGNIRSACNVEYIIVDLRIANRDGQTDYARGIPANCTRPDDLTQELGSPQEGRLAEALHYIDNGTCRPAASASSTSAKRSVTESGLEVAAPVALPVPANLSEGQRRRGAFVE